MSDNPTQRRIEQSIEVMHLLMRSCESCRQAPWEHLIYETFVCDGCAVVAR